MAICIPSLNAYSKIAASARLTYSSQQSWNFSKISLCSSVKVFSLLTAMQILRGEVILVQSLQQLCFFFFSSARRFLSSTAHQFLRFDGRWLTNLSRYGILTAEEKTRHGVNRLVTWRYEFAIIAAWFLGSDFELTTPLTIYGFGLRGNSAYKSIGKHRFRTKKHHKVNKSSQKTMAYLFGT